MKVLILTKCKRPFLRGTIGGVEDYIQNDHAFEGWWSGFRNHGLQTLLDGRSRFFIPLSVAYRFPKLYFWLSGLLFVTGLSLVDRYCLSRSIENRVSNENIDLIFTEINDFLSMASIDRMKKKGVVVTEWFGVFPDMVPKRILRTLDHYSHIWCPGDIVDEFRKRGVENPNIHYIETSFNEKFFHHEFEKKYAYDVCFVGGIGKPHSGRIPILEKVAERFERFAFYGYGIEQAGRSSALRKRFKGWADHHTMRKLFSSSKIALNLTLDGYDRVKKGVNARCFEIPACGGALQLSAFHRNMKDYFNDDEIAYFHDPDDLISKINYYLSREGERVAVVEKALQKAKTYSYSNKVPALMNIIQNGGKHRSVA
ncbi:MAG TPA: glycosyltransferase [Nitrospiria bacterium]|nr:glycosyltransferase [Nitrospiria bacterium]